MTVETPRIAILTSGGDCPGLNAAIRACAKTAILSGYEVIGVHNGWQGLLQHDDEILDGKRTSGIIDRGGTILGTSRVSPLKVENGVQRVLDRIEVLRLKAIVVLGGEGSLSLAHKLNQQGIPIVGIPKTIDNDVVGTDFSIGFQTAVQTATEALDKLRSTAESHHRVMLLEVMGRSVGWIATYAGLANGADEILIPEVPVTEEKLVEVCERLKTRRARGIRFSIVVVAEGVQLLGKTVLREDQSLSPGSNAPLLGGVGQALGQIIEQRTGLETRVSNLGYIQRGGSPVAYDRTLATAFGVKATNMILEKQFDHMTALKGIKIISVPLDKVVDKVKTVNMDAFHVARRFFA
jgi:phosphofructokinase-like protein